MAELLLIRHGETEWNREARVQGFQGDSSLTEVGRSQALALAARLAREGIAALYSSDAGRARQTVVPIVQATGLEVSFDAGLRERNYGAFEGCTYAEIEREFPEQYAKLRSRDPHHAPPGGESAIQFRDRILSALAAIAERAHRLQEDLRASRKENSGNGRPTRIAVVTHGGVIGTVHRVASGAPLDARASYTLYNASINIFRYDSGRWTMASWGDVAHFPAESLDEL